MPQRLLALLALVSGLALADEPVAAEATAAPPSFKDVSLSPVLTAGFGLGIIGIDIVGEVGAQTFCLQTLDDRKWLLQWDALAAARGGVLASTLPIGTWFGGGARGFIELGRRFSPEAAWSPYLGGRFTGLFTLLGHPGTPLSELNTINNSDGFGGLTLNGALRVDGGLSYLSARRSFVLAAFVEEALFAPGVVTAGLALTNFGLSARYDIEKTFVIYLEGFGGLTPAFTDTSTQITDQRVRLGVSGGLRKFFDNGVWFGVAASYSRDTNHTVYLDTHTAYDSAHPGTTSITLSFGVALWRPK